MKQIILKKNNSEKNKSYSYEFAIKHLQVAIQRINI